MRRRGQVVVTSNVPAAAERVWSRITSPEGINFELMPIMSMTMPNGVATLDIDKLPVGKPIGRSWLKLFGLVPVDYDDLCLVSVESGRSFHERSTMLSMREWQHERTVTPNGESCIVSDRLTFETRLPVPAAIPEAIVKALFGHRHRRMRRWFAAPLNR